MEKVCDRILFNSPHDPCGKPVCREAKLKGLSLCNVHIHKKEVIRSQCTGFIAKVFPIERCDKLVSSETKKCNNHKYQNHLSARAYFKTLRMDLPVGVVLGCVDSPEAYVRFSEIDKIRRSNHSASVPEKEILSDQSQSQEELALAQVQEQGPDSEDLHIQMSNTVI